MATRFRSLRFRTKVAVLFSIVFILLSMFSFIFTFEYAHNNYKLIIGFGSIGGSYTTKALWQQTWDFGIGLPLIIWLPRPIITSFLSGIYLPMWYLAPFVFIPTFFLWRKDRRIPDGHCQHCGYNLMGNVSGRCSECGHKVKVD